MRNQLTKLQKGKSTKAERIFSEILKELHVQFKTKVRIAGREIDFLVNNLAIEINGHPQVEDKNGLWLEQNIIPIHFDNRDIRNNKEFIKQEIIDILKYYGNDKN